VGEVVVDGVEGMLLGAAVEMTMTNGTTFLELCRRLIGIVRTHVVDKVNLYFPSSNVPSGTINFLILR
jgi:hypothetical protein